jgi:(2R)-3-sulfolactate dehydrogenase (NADP+)
MSTRLTIDEIEDLARRALISAGAAAAAAGSVARAVSAAERDGIASHGLLYVPTYCEHLKCGKVDGAAVPAVHRVAPAVVRVDAGTGFAHPAIDAGFPALIAAARDNGCALMTVTQSYNCGVLGYHVERLAESGLLGIGFTNAPACIAPSGGKRPVVGTNPVAVAVPDGRSGAALVIDQSSSVVAKSEIMVRARRGESIPAHWALDADGRPTTDPDQALKGSMAPAGGYKGFGIGLLVELMAAALSGSSLGIHASPFSGTAGGPPRTGQCFLAIDPGPPSGNAFSERVSDLVAAIEGQDGARLPGDRRQRSRARSLAEGVLVEDSLIATVSAYASASRIHKN